jgi:hypothetical protein
MNYSRLLLPTLLVLGAVAGVRAQCPIDEEYPYVFCKNGVAVVRCASDPHHVWEDGVKLRRADVYMRVASWKTLQPRMIRST